MEQTINSLVGIFLVIGLGYAGSRFNVVCHHTTKLFNRFLYYFALPVVIFTSILEQPLTKVLHWPYLGAYFLSVLVCALIMLLHGLRKSYTVSETVLDILCASQNNALYLGVPLFKLIYGNLAPLFPVIAFQAIIVAPLSLWLLDKNNRDSAPEHGFLVSSMLIIIRNPIILAALMGAGLSAYGWHWPYWAFMPMAYFGRFTLILTLLLLGCLLAETRHKHEEICFANVSLAIVCKNVLQPSIAILAGSLFFDLSSMWLLMLLLLTIMPSPNIAFIFAQRYQVAVAKTTVTVFFSNLVTLLTLAGLLIWHVVR